MEALARAWRAAGRAHAPPSRARRPSPRAAQLCPPPTPAAPPLARRVAEGTPGGAPQTLLGLRAAEPLAPGVAALAAAGRRGLIPGPAAPPPSRGGGRDSPPRAAPNLSPLARSRALARGLAGQHGLPAGAGAAVHARPAGGRRLRREVSKVSGGALSSFPLSFHPRPASPESLSTQGYGVPEALPRRRERATSGNARGELCPEGAEAIRGGTLPGHDPPTLGVDLSSVG